MMAPRKRQRRTAKSKSARSSRSRSRHGFGEGHLYAGALLLFLVGTAMIIATRLSFEPFLTPVELLPVGFLIASTLIFWVGFRGAAYQGDRIIPLLTLMLAGVGILVQFRLGSIRWPEWSRVTTYPFPLGLAGFLVTWLTFRKGRYEWLSRSALLCWLLAVVVLVGILMLGQRVRGAVFMPGQMNPAEVIKPLLAIFMAGMLTQYRKPLQQTVAGLPAPPWHTWMSLALLWAVPMVLLMVQRDLGMMIMLNLTLLLLIFVVTERWGYCFGGLAGITLASYAGFRFFSHARIRWMMWQDPFQDPTGRGWQILQSLSAMFSGGLFGSGLGVGVPGMVPIASSDFVYAVWAEELGYVGAVWLMILYMILFYRGYRVADQLRAPFAQTLAAGLVTMLAVQTLLNIGGVTKAIPLTGITLPLISHGGSSLVITFMMLGLLTALSEPTGGRGRK